jgi:hypothetical protein
MRPTTTAALLGLGLLAACAAPGPSLGPTPTVPASLADRVTDPARSAIANTAAVFGNPASVAGRPVQASGAIAQLEWLTVALVNDQRFFAMPPTVPGAVRQGRDAVRQAFGVAPETTPQAAVTAFDGAAAAFARNDRAAAEAALAPVTGAAGAARAAALLSALPVIREAAVGTAQASSGLSQMDSRAGPRFR